MDFEKTSLNFLTSRSIAPASSHLVCMVHQHPAFHDFTSRVKFIKDIPVECGFYIEIRTKFAARTLPMGLVSSPSLLLKSCRRPDNMVVILV